VKTNCKCNKLPGTWDSIEREWQINHENMMKQLHREEMREEIIKLITGHHKIWFSQSLNVGSSTFWANKASTAQALINEIRGLK
jgi:hypothetical protein